MLRKMIMTALAVAVVGVSAPQTAEARGGFGHGGGFHGGGFHGGGFHGGGFYRGGGWGHRHWHGGGFWPGVAIGAGLAGAGYYGGYYGYPYGAPYYYGTSYGYDDGYGGCYVARKRVMTPSGWRYREVDVCESDGVPSKNKAVDAVYRQRPCQPRILKSAHAIR